MTPGTAILCVGAAALVAWLVSALSGASLWIFRRRLRTVSPASRARITLALAMLPLLTTLAVMAAALAPSLGLLPDHCISSAAHHWHAHLCLQHPASLTLAPITLVASAFALRFALSLGGTLALAVRASRARKALGDGAVERDASGALVLPVSAPQAFVLGLVRPTLFVTRGLLETPHRRHLGVVLAHERAHVERHDALRRLCAQVGYVFHLPLIASAIDRELAEAHELAADDQAARTVGSRGAVARAIVELSRSAAAVPPAAQTFANRSIEIRVRTLIASPRRSGPGPRTCYALLCVGLFAVGVAADSVHHGVETLLGLMGS